MKTLAVLFGIVTSLSLAGALLLLGTLNPSEAAHSSFVEVSSMHLGTYSEQFCVQVLDGSMSQSTLYTRVRNTLYIDNPASDWDELAWDGSFYRIFWVGAGSTPCSSQPNRAEIEIEYYAHAGGCTWLGGSSCAWLGYVTSTHGNPTHYDGPYYYVRFRTSHVNGSSFGYHHTINHESGHILGLNDPPEGGLDCRQSVMHSAFYGCSNIEWPNQWDRDCATAVAFYSECY